MSAQVNELNDSGNHIYTTMWSSVQPERAAQKGSQSEVPGEVVTLSSLDQRQLLSCVHQVAPFSMDNRTPRLPSGGKGREVGLQSHPWQGWTLKSQLIRGPGRTQPGPLDLGPHGHINKDHSHTCSLPSLIKQSEMLLKQHLYSSKLPEKWKLWLTKGSSCRMLGNRSLKFLRHSSQSVRAGRVGYSPVSKHFHSSCTCSFQSLKIHLLMLVI